jgi:hypothetical protein
MLRSTLKHLAGLSDFDCFCNDENDVNAENQLYPKSGTRFLSQ